MTRQKISASLYRILLLTLAGLLVLGNFGRVSLGDRVAVYLQDGVLFCIALWTIAHWRAAFEMCRSKTWFRPLLAFVGAILLSLCISAITHPINQVVIGLAYAVRFILYANSVVYLLIGVSQKLMTKKHILFGLAVVTVFVATLGLFQYVFMPDVRFLQYLGYDDHYFRLISTYFDPPFTAQILIVGLFIMYSAKLDWRKKTPMLVLLFVALMLTYSRAEYLAFIAVIALMIQTGKRVVVGGIGYCS
jgi:hypothetical protein